MTIETQGQLGAARHESAQAAQKLADDLAAAQTEMAEQAKTLVVDGVPMAVAGLMVTLIGLLLQGVGTFV